MEHTREPWRVTGTGMYRYIDAPVGGGLLQEVAACPRVEYGDMEANARRIVACVNACADLSTEELERFGLASAFGTQVVELKSQRDELLATLQAVRAFLASVDYISRNNVALLPLAEIAEIDAAIAKAVGGVV